MDFLVSSPLPIGGMGNGTASADTSSSPQLALLDVFFPGFSMFTAAVQRYLGINLNLYIPLVAILGGLVVTWGKYSFFFVWGFFFYNFFFRGWRTIL